MSFEFFLSLFPRLIDGTVTTVLLLVVAGVFGNALAVLTALGRVSSQAWLRMPLDALTTVIRGTPLLVQIYLIYYGLGAVFAQTPAIRGSFLWPYLRDGFWYAVFALVISTAAYSGEVLRGALLSVPTGEVEAARSLGLRGAQIMRTIMIPRAIQICLPALGGETILLLKSTALASTITVMDMMGAANIIRSQTFRVYEPLLAAAAIYVALTFLLTRGFVWLERRLNRDRLAAR